MYQVTLQFTIEGAESKMEVARIVRAAILSSAIVLRNPEIQAIDYIPDEADDELAKSA